MAGDLDSEELLLSSGSSLAFLGVPDLQHVIKLTFREDKNWKVSRYWWFVQKSFMDFER